MAKGKGRAGWEWVGIMGTTAFGAVIVRGWPPVPDLWTALGAIATFLAVAVALGIGISDRFQRMRERRDLAALALSRLDGRLWQAIEMIKIAMGFAAQLPAADKVKAVDHADLAAGLKLIQGRLKITLTLVSDDGLMDAFIVFRSEVKQYIHVSGQVRSLFELFELQLAALEQDKSVASLRSACDAAHGEYLSRALAQLRETHKNFKACLGRA